MFITAHFQYPKQAATQFPLIDEWINKSGISTQWYPYPYSVIIIISILSNKKECIIDTCNKMWMNLKILCRVKDAKQKEYYWMVLFT